MTTVVLSVSSSRADVGILGPVWNALAERGAEQHVFATGEHTETSGGQLAPLLSPGARLHVGGAMLGGAGPEVASQATHWAG